MRTRTLTALALAGGVLTGCASQPSMLAARDRQNTSLEQCEQVTGSRIRAPDRTDCSPVGYPFRKISKDALDATGEIDLVEALRMLDPAFR